MFGLGNYDVNVIDKLLSGINCELKWHDNRVSFEENQDFMDVNLNTVGFLINKKEKGFFRNIKYHWIALK